MIESQIGTRQAIDDLMHGKITVDTINDAVTSDMARIKEVVEFIQEVAFHGLYSQACNGTMEYYLGVIKDATNELSTLTYKNWLEQSSHENGSVR